MSIIGEGGEAVDHLEDAQIQPGGSNVLEAAKGLVVLGEVADDLFGGIVGGGDEGIWAYIVLSIGFAKMNKSESTGKYYILVFAVWLIGTFIWFQITQAVPFLQGFSQ